MMKLATAAQYCDLSTGAFQGEVAAGRLPSPVNLGGRDHWFRPALDAALERIAGEMAADFEKEFWNRAASA
jgi:hypothetical protein